MGIWDRLEHDLEQNSGLRDIYVHDTDNEMWSSLLNSLPLFFNDVTFYKKGVKSDLPNSFTEAQDRDGDVLLQIKVGTCHINCHFYIENEIEFDIDTKEFSSEEQFMPVYNFMLTLARILQRPVHLTYEEEPRRLIESITP